MRPSCLSLLDSTAASSRETETETRTQRSSHVEMEADWSGGRQRQEGLPGKGQRQERLPGACGGSAAQNARLGLPVSRMERAAPGADAPWLCPLPQHGGTGLQKSAHEACGPSSPDFTGLPAKGPRPSGLWLFEADSLCTSRLQPAASSCLGLPLISEASPPPGSTCNVLRPGSLWAAQAGSCPPLCSPLCLSAGPTAPWGNRGTRRRGSLDVWGAQWQRGLGSTRAWLLPTRRPRDSGRCPQAGSSFPCWGPESPGPVCEDPGVLGVAGKAGDGPQDTGGARPRGVQIRLRKSP